MTGGGEITLTEAVRGLRAQLEQAIAEARDAHLKFATSEVTMEFQVGITRAAEGRGGLKFYVLELGGNVSRSEVETQTVTLKLRPVLDDGPVEIAGEQSPSPLASHHDSE